MAEECVVAFYPDTLRAKSAIDKLIASGYPQQNISLVTASLKNEPAAVTKALELGDQSEKDAAIGAGIGAAVGALGGATVVTAAGVGVVIAGPLAALTGVVVGGLIGAISGWGVHKDHIAKYEQKIKSGKGAGAGSRQRSTESGRGGKVIANHQARRTPPTCQSRRCRRRSCRRF